MKVLTGRNALVSIYIDTTWYPCLCATRCRFYFNHEEILISSRNSGKYVERMSRFMNWGFDLSGLTKIDDTDGQKGFFYFAQASVRGQAVRMRTRYTDADGNYKDVYGDVLVMDGELDSQVGGFSMANLRLPGTGEPSIGSVGTGTPINEFWLYLDTTEGAFEVSHADLGGATAISLVARDGRVFTEITVGTPSGMQFKFTDLGSSGKLTFSSTLPFNAGEVVYVRFFK